MHKGNFFQVEGNLTRKPEVYYSDGGNAYTYINVANNYMVRAKELDSDKGQGYLKKVHYFSVLAWGEIALSAQDLEKGTHVTVEGRIETYTKEIDGNPQTFMKLVAKTIYRLNGNKMQYYASAGNQDAKGKEYVPVPTDDFPLDISEVGQDDACLDPEIPF